MSNSKSSSSSPSTLTTETFIKTPSSSIQFPAPPQPQSADRKPLDGLPIPHRSSSNPLINNKSGVVPFPGLPQPQMVPLESPIMDNPDGEPRRPRYHSTVSQHKLSRTESGSNFTGKLKSLRKKIESELSRKRPGNATSGNRDKRIDKKKAQKGTVAGLRPSPALTVPENMTVADASQLCAAKRTDCVLVVDEEEGLSGIFTAKDLAFRVTAEGLDPRTTTVAQIMTKNPMVTRDTNSATDSLQLMVSKGFRHLPVCNEDGDVVGLLDITKVFHEALAKVERGSQATTQLHAALAGVQSELGSSMNANPSTAAIKAYVDALQDRMALPDLTSVMDTRTSPATVSPRTTVREAAKLMKERRTTAVCVMETNTNSSALSGASGTGGAPKIAGIFTSKDIVLRVIAAGLDAQRCSVVRVMTPHPDTAPPTMTVQDALKKMHNGHYLNLPVVDKDGRLSGIVDVLKLTYATLEQIESMNKDHDNDPASGEAHALPRVYDWLGGVGPEDDSASIVSASERPDTPSRPQRGNIMSPTSELLPGDSASAIDDNSEVGKRGVQSSLAPSAPVDDGTYVFKFRTPSGRTHRFQARHDSYELLRDIISGKLQTDPFFAVDPASTEEERESAPDPNTFSVSYTDDENDTVTMTADGDVADAVKVARHQKKDRVVLLVDGGKGWADAARVKGGEKAVVALLEVEQNPKVIEEEEKQEKLEEKLADASLAPTYGAKGAVHAPVTASQSDLIGGVLPKELVLPAAIGFLGVVIAGVFVASRASK